VTVATRVDRGELIAPFGFPLDEFQLEALDALDRGDSVLVAAPTGSGKTVVAEYAVAAALADGRRAFYTAPIKALSNQKYHDLCRRFGAEQVGLLTGDNSINGDAPVVVMTTEVLRNMIYARAVGLARLGVVVLDEVHFIQDTYRGPVWEEVIIHLPASVQLVCLSATVSNAEEVTDWITTVRGRTHPVVETRRPVRLEQLHLVGDRTSERLHLLPVILNGRANPEAVRLDEDASRTWRGAKGRQRTRRRLFTPSRLEVVDRLDEEGFLPAICFIFSRNQCDEAARTCLAAGMRLTDGTERERIRQIVDERLGELDAADLAVLGYGQFLAQLEAGIAAHHAGMVPPFKEVVEACFAEGLVKVVFATETLAVGINMPARSVVIEKLTKFTGDHHASLTPGEYTQLTGRAGRRGIDEVGHAITLWSPFVPFEQVASLATSRAFRLSSAFRPTYNMAANLVRSYTSAEAHHLLNLSFAQYQADRDVVRLEARIERRQRQMADLRVSAVSPYGDVDEYRRTRSREERRAAAGPAGRDHPVEQAIMKLRPGDVIYVEKGRYAGRAAVLASAHRKGGMKLTVLTTRRDSLHLDSSEFDEPPRAIGRIDLPVSFAPNRQDYQKEVVRRLVKARVTGERPARSRPQQVDPVERDPELRDRLRAAAHADRIEREVDDLRHRVRSHSSSVARRFDQVLEVLAERDYTQGWALTEWGEVLARVFHESDLLVTETMRQGLFDDLAPSQLAALASVFVYEHRSPEAPPAPWFPSPDVRTRWRRIEQLSLELAREEERIGLAVHRAPDPTFIAVAYAWAAGEGFAQVVAEEELSGGDFVRTTKQLIDLLRQLAVVAPAADTRRRFEQAADSLFRGVVAASSTIEAERPG
jgi:ATP-dependent RNA helicase HelY